MILHNRFLSLSMGLFLAAAILLGPTCFSSQAGKDFACEPTRSDFKGPYYKPDAPVRDKVGEGYVLSGTVKSAEDCSPVSDARIEIWLAGPDGEYDAAHRATMFSGSQGRYSLQTDFPGTYGSRPPHIHLQVAAEGYKALVTQHYPDRGTRKGNLDLVLVPRK